MTHSDQDDLPYRLHDWPGAEHLPEVTRERFDWQGYAVEVVLRPVAGRKVITELHVTTGAGDPPAAGLTSALLRTLPLGQLREEALEVEARGDAHTMLAGAVRRDDTFYASVAAAYVDLLAVNATRPAEAVANAAEAPVRTVHAWLHRARKRGLLTSAGAGMPGGELTDKARALLDAAYGTTGD